MMQLKAISLVLLIGASLACTPESLNFAGKFKIPRSKTELLLDQHIPLDKQKNHKLTSWHNLKIVADTSGIDYFKSKNPVMYKFMVETLIPSIVKHMSDTFKVREEQQVKVDEAECVEAKVPTYLRSNQNADLILLFTAQATETDSFVAWAAPCQLHDSTMRPLVGQVNMNPYFLNFEKKQFFDQFATVLHEIYHIMGFNPALYSYFIDPATLKRMPESQVIIKKSTGTFPVRIITPSVVSFAKQHFGCNTIDGVPLEDEGGSGSVGAHWEKVVLGNEMMVSDQVANPVLSRFTLSLLQDSGWYQINWAMEEPIFWEKGKGCSILEGKCAFYGSTCRNEGDEGCFYDYTFQASCSTGTFTNMCNFFTGTNFNKHDCRVEENKDLNAPNLGEYFGLGSRCFNGALKADGTTNGNMCYKSKCVNGVVKLNVAGKEYTCSNSGQQITPDGMSGYITCPNLSDYCAQLDASCTDDCGLNGRCVMGNKCYCYLGYSGATCSTKSDSAIDYSVYKGTCPDNCLERGSCSSAGVCVCTKGFTGTNCGQIDIIGLFSGKYLVTIGMLIGALVGSLILL